MMEKYPAVKTTENKIGNHKQYPVFLFNPDSCFFAMVFLIVVIKPSQISEAERETMPELQLLSLYLFLHSLI
jgi:hypothetical protein